MTGNLGSRVKAYIGEYENKYDDYKTDDKVLTPIEYVIDGSVNYIEQIKATKGRYDKYADEIAYEMKVLVEFKWETTENKYKILKYEVIGD
jgi:hypothetical protein